MSGNRLAAAMIAAALAAPAAATIVDLFPTPNEIFPLLIADPRHIQLSASYYRLRGQNESDIALGHSWGLTRWRTDNEWLWESDIEGMAYSRFQIGGGINKFQTVDFVANLPVTIRRDALSLKGTLFHESAHLGDDYIRDTGIPGFRYSTEGLRAQGSWDAGKYARFYGGAEWLLHAVPAIKRWTLQNGAELDSGERHWLSDTSTSLFLAEDIQWHQRVQWNMDSHTVAGVKIGFDEAPARDMRVSIGYFIGHSPFGQFFAQREHYADVSIELEF